MTEVVELTVKQIKDRAHEGGFLSATLHREAKGYTLSLHTETEHVRVLRKDAGEPRSWVNLDKAVAFIRETTAVTSIHVNLGV